MRGNGVQRDEVGAGLDPSWSPDGDQLVVASTCGNEVLLLDPETREASLLFTGVSSPAGLAWSPDGAAIAFPCGNDLCLYPMNDKGSGVQKLTDHDLGVAVGRPSWSPSGGKIAYSSGACDGSSDCLELPSDIWVVNRDGSGKVKLTDGTGHYFNPSWSPVEEMIAFNSISKGEDHLMLMNADGSEQRRIGNGFLYGWSPDGSRIYFSMPGDDGLWTMNRDGSNPTLLFKLDCESPVWSRVSQGQGGIARGRAAWFRR